jgi:polysaccharide pyruvyl transferase WcaK-like protein
MELDGHDVVATSPAGIGRDQMYGVAKARLRKKRKVYFFGNFGKGNLGNEATFQTILAHLRRFDPGAEVACICTEPEITAATHSVPTISISADTIRTWTPRNRVARMWHRLTVGIPAECRRWWDAFVALKDADVLIVPGTGLLTDAFGLNSWGPYRMFEWALIAKLRGCKLLFVSVGAGPVYSRIGRMFVKSALGLADYRSYRDTSSQHYLRTIGFVRSRDRVYPDLVFGLSNVSVPVRSTDNARRVVGVGVMEYAGRYSVDKPGTAVFRRYLEALGKLVEWLMGQDYDVRLLIGDFSDKPVMQEFRSFLNERLTASDASRIIDEPASSVEELASQIAATDIVVATRFHNVLMALLFNKPVTSISFHHKCASLMKAMGLSEYCLDINDLTAEQLIGKVSDLEQNSIRLKSEIRKKTEEYRAALDEQYNHIFQEITPAATTTEAYRLNAT